MWQGSRMANGYGRISVRGRVMNAHRAAYLAEHGELPPLALVIHACDEPACVEASHLRAGSPADNMADRRERTGFNDLAPFGEANGKSKLTEVQVLEIRWRANAGETFAALGRSFGVSRQTASDIAHRKLWTHVN
jgi:hypothetical protein